MLKNTIVVIAVINWGLEVDGPMGINYLPLRSNGLNMQLSPSMLGEIPRLIIEDKSRICQIFSFLTKQKTSNKFHPEAVHFIFRIPNRVIYVDSDGVVKDGNLYFKVEACELEDMVIKYGYPNLQGTIPIPPKLGD